MHNGLFINLESRLDRKELFLAQFADISGFNILRFNAIPDARGALGCTLSHIGCLEAAKSNNWDHVLIFEDDFELIVTPAAFKAQMDLLLRRPWDVLMISGYVLKCDAPVDSMCKVQDAQSTVAYAVRKSYYDTLIANFQESYAGLRDSKEYRKYALDQYWKRLQVTGDWRISFPILGKQRAGFSDIENTVVNYDRFFLGTDINRTLLP